jgi:DNA invertase Pin-like site-specific DNA recombinase
VTAVARRMTQGQTKFSQLRVALYARVSTRDKDQNPDVQLEPMREYASIRGWNASEYVDRAAAADMRGRTAWGQLVADARRRRIDLVFVWKLDRAFRSTLHCLRTLEAWQAQGVGFACLTQDVDTTSPTGQLLLTILAAVAEFERSLIGERVKEGMTNARRRGVRIGRPPAVERPHVARHLEEVREAVSAGTLSKRKGRVDSVLVLELLSACLLLRKGTRRKWSRTEFDGRHIAGAQKGNPYRAPESTISWSWLAPLA